MKITVSLTKAEADELLRCELRRMMGGGYAYKATRAQESAIFKLRGAVISAHASSAE